MSLSIEKRTRVLATDVWGAWASTTDAPPYTDTDLIEYKVGGSYSNDKVPVNDPITITATELTSGAITQDSDGNYIWQGTGIFDTLMEAVNGNVKVEFDSGRIVGPEYASTYLGSLQAALQASIQFGLSKDGAEAAANSKRFTLDNILPVQAEKAQVDYDLAEGTYDSKVALAANQANKVGADTSYVAEQEQQLINSVTFNNKIKALGSMADTYGTFGAGGLTLSTDMWTTYYSVIEDLSGAAVPTTTTVTKVV